jgi:hypothetical protein
MPPKCTSQISHTSMQTATPVSDEPNPPRAQHSTHHSKPRWTEIYWAVNVDVRKESGDYYASGSRFYP